jgi:DNA repair protein RecO (recombination protein O)
MHAIHHTRAVILKSLPSKEGDKLIWLFTEEFGLVVAVATGIRKPGAKLASQLIDYSFVEADLVKGREVWRLVSAVPIMSPVSGRTTHPLARAYVRMLATLERFLVDEGVHIELFFHIYECAQLVKEGMYTDSKRFDTLAIWRTLELLGYIAVEDADIPLTSMSFLKALELLDEDRTRRMITAVNATIKETHL